MHVYEANKNSEKKNSKYYLYNKGDYQRMKEETETFNESFMRERYFNGMQNSRNLEKNWKLIKAYLRKS